MEIVYVMTNPAMPGLVKIGRTRANTLTERQTQLYTTGVPFPFDVVFACRVHNANDVEKALHLAFHPNRVNSRREFFNIEPDQAIAILKLLHVEDATQEASIQPSEISAEEIRAADEYKKSRRPALDFNEMGIPLNSVLQFTETGETAIVVSNKKVSLNGHETSLTAATRQILNLDYNIQPSRYWTYRGETLRDIYERTYIGD